MKAENYWRGKLLGREIIEAGNYWNYDHHYKELQGAREGKAEICKLQKYGRLRQQQLNRFHSKTLKKILLPISTSSHHNLDAKCGAKKLAR